MCKRALAFAIAAILLAGCKDTNSHSSSGSDPVGVSSDSEYFNRMGILNSAEIQGAQLAQTRSSSDLVKDYARTIISDHTEVAAKLTNLAKQMGIRMPAELDNSHQRMLDALNNFSGERFDKFYVRLQPKLLGELISTDQAGIDHANDQRVRSLAGDLLPTLKAHLEMSQRLQAAIRGE